MPLHSAPESLHLKGKLRNSTDEKGQVSGHLLCRLEAAAPKQHGESDAIACDPTRPEECLTYCYVMDDGSMVCSVWPCPD